MIKPRSAAPVVSVVIPVRGHSKELLDGLAGLRNQEFSGSFEVIVVDSACDPGVAAAVEPFPDVRLLRSTEGLLPGDARNLGVAHAEGRYLAFMDADCVPEPRWLDAAVGRLAEGARVGGGPVTDALPREVVAVCDNLLQFADFPPTRPNGPAEYFPACNLALSRADFETLGGFKHRGDLAGEDTSFCNEAMARWPGGLFYVQNMRVSHTGRTTLGGYLRHHHFFGRTRGVLGHHLKPAHKRLGRYALMIPLIALKRYQHIVKRSAQWRPRHLASVALLTPLLLTGLTAWAVGFRRGLREAVEESS